MKAVITGENDERVGVNLRDNNDAEHVIEMDFDGEIKFHQCEAYADKPADRTPEENEHNEQARRFAQYYVSVERGYDTVPPEIHPERIDAVRLAIQTLSDEQFQEYFGDLERQLRSYHDDSVKRAIPIPSGASSPNSVLYRQHVYLGIDPLETDLADEAATIASEHDLDLSDADRPIDQLGEDAVANWQAFTAELASSVREQSVDAREAIEIGGVSSLYTAYVDDSGIEHVGEPEFDPFDRDPDTLIELAPIDPGPLEEFRAYFDHYLKCQIRDCYLRMGLHPPAEFCVLGPGRIEAAEQYKTLEMFPDFTDPENEALLDRP